MPGTAPHDIESKSLARKMRKLGGGGGGGVGGVVVGKNGRRWDPALHPRDANGRFIETGGSARVWGRSDTGKVTRMVGRGRVELLFPDGHREIHDGSRLTMIKRPDGGKPTKSKTKVLDEDDRRAKDPKRGDGREADDLGDRDGDGVPDKVDAAPDDANDKRRKVEPPKKAEKPASKPAPKKDRDERDGQDRDERDPELDAAIAERDADLSDDDRQDEEYLRALETARHAANVGKPEDAKVALADAERRRADREQRRKNTEADSVDAGTGSDPAPNQGDPSERDRVREEGPDVLGDVPAQPGGNDGEPGGVLPEPGRAGGGAGREQRGGDPLSAPVGDGDDGAGAGTPAGAAGGRGDRDGGPRVPDAGAGDRGPRAAVRAARGGRAGVEPSADRPAEKKAPKKSAAEAAKMRDNIAALRTLRKIEAEDREATPEEREILKKWAGWGALAEVFNEKKTKWDADRAELRDLIPEDEWVLARQNALNAHYTDNSFVEPVWDALEKLGFKGGRVLEPGSGSGNFIERAPKGTRMVGVELEPTTAKISQLIHPDATIRNEGFQDTRLPVDSFDAAVGNVPFGKYVEHDPVFNKAGHTIHNAFIIKTLAMTKPGGIVALHTSRYTLDGDTPKSRKAREDMLEMGDLVGAVRLPAGAHEKTAGTQVVTDLLLFRKRKPGEQPGDLEWLDAPKTELADGTSQNLNSYFSKHPDNVLGELRSASGMYGPEQELTVVGDKKNAGANLKGALDRITRDADRLGLTADPTPAAGPDPQRVAPRRRPAVADTMSTPAEVAADSLKTVQARRKTREGSVTKHEKPFTRTVTHGKDGKKLARPRSESTEFTQVLGGEDVPHYVPKTQAEEFGRLVDLADAFEDLLDAEAMSSADTPQIMALRKRLNDLHDDYVKKHGPINRFEWSDVDDIVDPDDVDADAPAEARPPKRLFPPMGGARTMPHLQAAFALEGDYDPDTKTAKKADVFTKRTVARRELATKAESTDDAVALSLEGLGRLDVDTIAQSLGVSKAEARSRLLDEGLAFEQPGDDDSLVPRAEYLSGNVRARLKDAIAAAADGSGRYDRNIAELEKAVPEDKTPAEIHVQLGAPWISRDVIQDFADAMLDTPFHVRGKRGGVKVEHLGASTWKVTGGARGDALASQTWGTKRRPMQDILQAALTQSPVQVHDEFEGPDGKVKKVLNIEETEAAQAKAEELAERFADWVWEDPERANLLQARFNETFRSHVSRTYDGSPDRAYPGMVAGWAMRGHQTDGVTRIVNEPSAMLAHVVGAGKTATMQAGAMELRRLGLANKPGHVIPNHMLEQYTREFKELYPQSNLLAVDTKTLGDANKRRQFLARVAAGDWDSVVFTQEAFKSIPLSEDNTRAYLTKELDGLRRQLERAKGEGSSDATVKQVETAVKNAENKIRKLLDTRKDDGGVTFEKLGIDYLFVDEAHMYKNLRTVSKDRSLTKAGSQKATDLDMKLDYLRGSSESGRVVTLATGTPIANSISEAYIMQRYLRPDLLRDAEIDDFDSWLAMFGEKVTSVEMSVDGNSFKPKTRVAKFRNAGELIRMWSVATDVKRADHLKLPRPDLTKDEDGKRGPKTIAIKRTPAQAAYISWLGERAEAVKSGAVPPEEDNMLKISSDGRKAALDMRLIDDPGFEALWGGRKYGDSPKVDATVNDLFNRWEATKDRGYDTHFGSGEKSNTTGGLQIVFADLGTPNDDGRFSVYDEIRKGLVARGMPREQVRFIHEAKTADEKARLFDEARAGKISVLIGSTEKMGTGTNVQDRALSVTHMDVPWRPADLEQRDGRVIRQKNQNTEVDVVRMVTEGTFDAFMWGGVERKAGFIEQVYRGDVDADEIEDIGDSVADAAAVKAIASGNPLLVDQAFLKNELTKLKRRQRAHQRNVGVAQRASKQKASDIRAAERDIAQLEDAKDRSVDVSGKKFAMETGRWGRSRFTTRPEAGNALADEIDKFIGGAYIPSGTSQGYNIGNIGGHPIELRTRNVQGFTPEAIIDLGFPGSEIRLTKADLGGGKNRGAGIITRLENRLSGIDDEIRRTKRRQANAGQEIERLDLEAAKTFRQADELDVVEKRAKTLDSLLALHSAESEEDRAKRDVLRDLYKDTTKDHEDFTAAKKRKGEAEAPEPEPAAVQRDVAPEPDPEVSPAREPDAAPERVAVTPEFAEQARQELDALDIEPQRAAEPDAAPSPEASPDAPSVSAPVDAIAPKPPVPTQKRRTQSDAARRADVENALAELPDDVDLSEHRTEGWRESVAKATDERLRENRELSFQHGSWTPEEGARTIRYLDNELARRAAAQSDDAPDTPTSPAGKTKAGDLKPGDRIMVDGEEMLVGMADPGYDSPDSVSLGVRPIKDGRPAPVGRVIEVPRDRDMERPDDADGPDIVQARDAEQQMDGQQRLDIDTGDVDGDEFFKLEDAPAPKKKKDDDVAEGQQTIDDLITDTPVDTTPEAPETPKADERPQQADAPDARTGDGPGIPDDADGDDWDDEDDAADWDEERVSPSTANWELDPRVATQTRGLTTTLTAPSLDAMPGNSIARGAEDHMVRNAQFEVPAGHTERLAEDVKVGDVLALPKDGASGGKDWVVLSSKRGADGSVHLDLATTNGNLAHKRINSRISTTDSSVRMAVLDDPERGRQMHEAFLKQKKIGDITSFGPDAIAPYGSGPVDRPVAGVNEQYSGIMSGRDLAEGMKVRVPVHAKGAKDPEIVEGQVLGYEAKHYHDIKGNGQPSPGYFEVVLGDENGKEIGRLGARDLVAVAADDVPDGYVLRPTHPNVTEVGGEAADAARAVEAPDAPDVPVDPVPAVDTSKRVPVVEAERVDVDQTPLRVGDVLHGKYADGGEGPLRVTSWRMNGRSIQAEGVDDDGNRRFVTFPDWAGAKILERAPEGAPEAFNAPTDRVDGDRPGSYRPSELRLGDVIDAKIKVGTDDGAASSRKPKVSADVKVVGEPKKQGAFWKVETEDSHGKRHVLHLSDGRPVTVKERGDRDRDRDRTADQTTDAPDRPADDRVADRDKDGNEDSSRATDEPADSTAPRDSDGRSRDRGDEASDQPADRDRDEEREKDEDADDRDRDREKDDAANERDRDREKDDDPAEPDKDKDRDETDEERERREEDEERRRREEEEERRRREEEDEDDEERRRRRNDDDRRRRRKRRKKRRKKDKDGPRAPHLGLPHLRLPHLPDGTGGRGRGDNTGAPSEKPDPEKLAAPLSTREVEGDPGSIAEGIGRVASGDGSGVPTDGWSLFNERMDSLDDEALLDMGHQYLAAGDEDTYIRVLDELIRREDEAPSLAFVGDDELTGMLNKGASESELNRVLGEIDRRENAGRYADNPELDAEFESWGAHDVAEMDAAVDALLDGDTETAVAALRTQKPTRPEIRRQVEGFNEDLIDRVVRQAFEDGELSRTDGGESFQKAVGARVYDMFTRGKGVPAVELAKANLEEEAFLRLFDKLPGEIRELGMSRVHFPGTRDIKDAIREVDEQWAKDTGAEIAPVSRRDVDDTIDARRAAFTGDEPFVELAAQHLLPGDVITDPRNGSVREVVGADRLGNTMRLAMRGENGSEFVDLPLDDPIAVAPSIGRTVTDAPELSRFTPEGATVDRDGHLRLPGSAESIAPDQGERFSPDSLSALEGTRAVVTTPDGQIAGLVAFDRANDILTVGGRDLPADEVSALTLLAGEATVPGAPVLSSRLPNGTKVTARVVDRDGKDKMLTGHLTGITREGHRLFVDDAGSKHIVPATTAVRPFTTHTSAMQAPENGALPGVWARAGNGAVTAQVPGEWSASVVRGLDGRYHWNASTGGAGGASGASDSVEDAKSAARAALAEAGEKRLPRDRNQLGVDPAADQPTEPPASVGGHTAEWVPVGDLGLGEVVRVIGYDQNGTELTEAGVALSYPRPVNVDVRGRGREPMFAVVVGDDMDGSGERRVVFAKADALAARAIPKEAADEDAQVLTDGAESDVLTGRVPDFVPVDRSGRGLYPGTAVNRLSDGREGVVKASRGQDVSLIWENGDEQSMAANALNAVDGGESRPAGWTSGGRRLMPGSVVTYKSDTVATANTPGGREERTRGVIVALSGDDVTVSTPNGEVKRNAADLGVVSAPGSEAAVSPSRLSAPFDALHKVDIPTFEPIAGDLVQPHLTPESQRTLMALGFDIDSVSDPQVQQAAGRLIAGLPVTAEQRTALSGAIDAARGPAREKSSWSRALRRLSSELNDAAAADVEPEQVHAEDVTPGDRVVAPGTDGPRVVTVHDMSPDGWDVTNEDGQAERIPAPKGEVTVMPEPPRDVDVDADEDGEVTDRLEEAVARSGQELADQRVRDTAASIAEHSLGDAHEATSIGDLRERIAARLVPDSLAPEIARVGSAYRQAVARSSVDDETKADMRRAAQLRTDAVESAMVDVILATINDAEPLPGETWPATRERVSRMILDASKRIGAKHASEASAARPGPTPPPGQAPGVEPAAPAQPTLDWIPALPDLSAQDPLGFILPGTKDWSPTELDEAKARLDQIADEHVRAAVVRMLWRLPRNYTAEDVARFEREIMDEARKPAPKRQRQAARVVSRRGRAQISDQVAYKIGFWLTDAVIRVAKAIVRALRAALGRERDGEELDGKAIARAEYRRLRTATPRHAKQRRRPEPGRFAMKRVNGRRHVPAAPSPAPDGKDPEKPASRPQSVIPGTRPTSSSSVLLDDGGEQWVVDRAADDGPGRSALGQLEQIRTRGAGFSGGEQLERAVQAKATSVAADRAVRDAIINGQIEDLDTLMRAAGDLSALAQRARADAATHAQTVLMDELREARDFGEADGARLNLSGDPEAVEAVRWASQFYPTDWIRASSGQKFTVLKGDRGEVDVDAGTITLAGIGQAPGANAFGQNALHELAHVFEAAMPDVGRAQWTYHYDRTSEGEVGRRRRAGANARARLADLEPGAGHGDSEVSRPDSYPDTYIGREYSGMTHFEIMSMAMESIFGGAEYIDQSMRQFVLGLIADLGKNDGVLPGVGKVQK